MKPKRQKTTRSVNWWAVSICRQRLSALLLPFLANRSMTLFHCHLGNTCEPMLNVYSFPRKCVAALIEKIRDVMIKNGEKRHECVFYKCSFCLNETQPLSLIFLIDRNIPCFVFSSSETWTLVSQVRLVCKINFALAQKILWYNFEHANHLEHN